MSESTGTVVACVNIADTFAPATGVCASNGLKQGEFFQLTFDENGAVSLEWYRNLFAPTCSIEELIHLAQSVDSTAGLVALPCAYRYQGLEAFEGITPKHTHGHFIRAIMESVALTLNKLVHKLAAGGLPETIVSTGGGAKSRYWLSIKSEIAAPCRFVAANCEEPACKGAAMLCRKY